MINKIQREVSNDTNNNAFGMISLIAALDVAFAHTLAHVLGGGGMEQHLIFGF